MKERFLSTIVILTILLIVCSCLNKELWGIQSKDELNKIVNMFGVPTEKYSNPGGFAKWDKINREIPLNNITVFDNNFNKEYVHINIKYEMDSKKIQDVISLYDGIIYDDTKDELIVSSDSFSKGMYILRTIINFHNNLITQEEAVSSINDYKNENITEEGDYRFLQGINADYNLKYPSMN